MTFLWNKLEVAVAIVSLELSILSNPSQTQAALKSSNPKAVQLAKLRMVSGLDASNTRYSRSAGWANMINTGIRLSRHVLGTLEIPRGKEKALERAAGLFRKIRKLPRKPTTWWAKNYKHVQFLLSAKNWPERTEESASVAKVGPFTVHNTLGEDPSTTHKALEKVVQLLRSSRIPRLPSMLYGEVYVVGNLKEPRTMAWYNDGEDRVYLRQHLKVGPGEVRNLIHELGHRYWSKGPLKPEQKRAWKQHHQEIRGTGKSSGDPEVLFQQKMQEFRSLSVGDKFPRLFKGWVRGVTVVGFRDQGREGWVVRNSKGRTVLFETHAVERAVRSSLGKLRVDNSYPTPYSSTSPEEHFCEALSLHVVGKLPPDHMQAFERIIVKGDLEMSRKADLMPPLGYPGGTCHVVQRIDDASPRNEDRLIDLVESGKGLSNSEASKVYSLAREKGVWKFQNLLMTAHVQYRMDFRGITVPEVRLALASFFRNYNNLRSQKNKPDAVSKVQDIEMSFMRGSELVWTDPKLNKLSIVFTADVKTGQIKLITAMWKGQRDPSPAACKLASRWLATQE